MYIKTFGFYSNSYGNSVFIQLKIKFDCWAARSWNSTMGLTDSGTGVETTSSLFISFSLKARSNLAHFSTKFTTLFLAAVFAPIISH